MAISYKKHPKGTPKWLTRSIFWLGGSIGGAIILHIILAIMSLGLVLNSAFINIPVPTELMDALPNYALIGVVHSLAAMYLIMLALAMNSLQRIAQHRSILALVATGLAAVVSLAQFTTTQKLPYSIPELWVWISLASFLLAGVLPMLAIRSQAGRKLHKS